MSNDAKGLRTPLARVRSLGAAGRGTAETWTVHVTAVALVILSAVFVVMVLDLLHMDYNGVRATLGAPIPAILLLAFILAGIVHMEIGMRSIIIDYVHGHRTRAVALLANICFAALLGLTCVYAALRISFT